MRFEDCGFYNRFELDELNPYIFCVDDRIYHLYTYIDEYNNTHVIGQKESLFEYFRSEIQYMSIYNDNIDIYLKAIRIIRNTDIENSRLLDIELNTDEYEINENCFIYFATTNYNDEWL